MPTFETISNRLQKRKFVSTALQIASPILALLFTYSSILESWKSGIVYAVILWIVLALSTNKTLKFVLSKMSTRQWNWDFELHYSGQEALSDPNTFTPRWIYWQPYTNQLLVSRDHERFNVWSLEIAKDTSEVKWTSQTEDQCIFSQGWINHVFFSPEYTLIDSEHKWNYKSMLLNHTLFIDRNGRTVAHLRWWESFALFGTHKSMPFMERSSNPFRPGFSGDLLMRDYSSPHMFTVSVDELSRVQEDRVSIALSKGQLRELSVDGIDLSLIREKDDIIGRHTWHPSGNYIAVQIGRFGSDGLVYVIHWSSADIVAVIEHPEDKLYSLEDWSPDGSLLKMQTAIKGVHSTVVWDCFTGEVRPLHPDEAWPSSLIGWQNRDYRGKLFSTSGYGFLEPRGHWKDAAWWPTDPSYCASVGGEGAERFVRIWRTTK